MVRRRPASRSGASEHLRGPGRARRRRSARPEKPPDGGRGRRASGRALPPRGAVVRARLLAAIRRGRWRRSRGSTATLLEAVREHERPTRACSSPARARCSARRPRARSARTRRAGRETPVRERQAGRAPARRPAASATTACSPARGSSTTTSPSAGRERSSRARSPARPRRSSSGSPSEVDAGRPRRRPRLVVRRRRDGGRVADAPAGAAGRLHPGQRHPATPSPSSPRRHSRRVGLRCARTTSSVDPALAPGARADAARRRPEPGAVERLGWRPTLSFEQLVARMVDADLRALR